MKAQYFVYTRTRNLDYRTFFSPSEELCPKEIRTKFLKEIRGVIDIETYDDPLNTPRWLYSYSNGLLLFGVGIMNAELSETCKVDFANRPVRGFFGIILSISNDEIFLPMDINLFRQLYKKYIEPIWELDREHIKIQTIEIDIKEYIKDSTHIINPENKDLSLNFHEDKCVILGKVSPEDAFSRALTLKQEISIVTGFNNKKHAYCIDSDYKYKNVIVNNVIEREEKLYNKKQEQINTQDIRPLPKKVLRPKLFTIGLIVAVVLSMIIWVKSCLR